MPKKVIINPRSRYVAPILRSIIGNARGASYTWFGPRSEWNAQEGRSVHVPAKEQPENTMADWQRLYEYAETMEKSAGTLRKLAARMVQEMAGE